MHGFSCSGVRTTGQLSLPGNGRIGLVSKSDVGRCLAALASRGPVRDPSADQPRCVPCAARGYRGALGGRTHTPACSPPSANSAGTGSPPRCSTSRDDPQPLSEILK